MKRQDFLKKHSPRSKLEEEKIRKRLLEEEEERLEATGQRSDKKAAKWVIEEMEEKEEQEEEGKNFVLTRLKDKKKNFERYATSLLFYFRNALSRIGWPDGYMVRAGFDGKGIRIIIKDKHGQVHQKAFRVSRKPKYDYNACERFAVWAEDIKDSAEGKLYMGEEDKIWTPNKN